MRSFPPIWRRFTAIIYDSLLLMAVSMAYGGVSLLIYQQLTGTEDLVSGLGFQVGWLLIIVLFFCFFWQRAGQTLGMQAWRLRVVKKNLTTLPDTKDCLIRLMLAPLGLLFFFTACFREDKQCLHDIISGTRLILIAKEK